MPLRKRFITAAPAARDDARFRWSTFGSEAPPGKDNPRASPIDDIVLAVNMPPHEPGPGHAFISIP